MKILHISGARSWGGNEQQLVDLIPELNKLNVTNLVFGVKGSPLQEYFTSKETVFLFGNEPKIHKKGNFELLKRLVEEHRPDVIHLHTSDSVTLFVVADILYNLKTPAVLSKKGMGSSMSFLSIYKYNYKGIKKIICVSEAVKKELQEKVIKQKNGHRLEVVYDGVNLDRTTVVRTEKLKNLFGIRGDIKILGNIANHAKAKDLEVLVKMMSHLVHDIGVKDIHLVQIGSFSGLTEDLKQEIKNLGLEDFITLGGFQNNALDFIPQFDIYVMSSQREGLPITIFESFLKGTPVVSTKAGGIPEAITEGENGFLAEVKDHKTLAEKVAILLEDEELKRDFAEKSKEIFYNRFVAGITAKNTLEIYKKVVSQ